MNKITEKIFGKYKPNFGKLCAYGFTHRSGEYGYKTVIMDGQFSLSVRVSGADIDTEVTDLATDEPYTLFLADGASGSFVGAVRSAYEEILTDIAVKCFDKSAFKSEYAQKLIEYVSDTYGDDLEFLWEKFDDNAIWRRKDNNKWYGLLLTVKKDRLGFDSDEKVEIIDLKVSADEIDNIVDGKKFFRGYHMNKKHWITIRLDGSVPLSDIERMLDKSYELA